MRTAEKIYEASVIRLHLKGDYLVRCEHRDLKEEAECGFGLFKENLLGQGFSEEVYKEALGLILERYEVEKRIRNAIKI